MNEVRSKTRGRDPGPKGGQFPVSRQAEGGDDDVDDLRDSHITCVIYAINQPKSSISCSTLSLFGGGSQMHSTSNTSAE